jgi:hypothetical protein
VVVRARVTIVPDPSSVLSLSWRLAICFLNGLDMSFLTVVTPMLLHCPALSHSVFNKVHPQSSACRSGMPFLSCDDGLGCVT